MGAIALLGNEDYSVPPEVKLADLLREKLDVSIAPAELRAFVIEDWRKLSLWCHRIHDGDAPRNEAEAADGN